MSQKDYRVKAAQMFKSMENPVKIGNIIGKVIESLPDVKISILDGSIILEKEQLYCCDHVLNNYKREFEIKGKGTIIHKTPPAPILYSEHTEIEDISISGDITKIDTIVPGDLVLLSPAEGEQVWFILDKITKL